MSVTPDTWETEIGRSWSEASARLYQKNKLKAKELGCGCSGIALAYQV
jgi:hypothetical protein